MRIMMTLVMIGMLSLGGCAYLQSITDSKQFKEFCAWAPVANQGIEAAIQEAMKDPAKANVVIAMSQAVQFLRLASAQCPVVTAAP